MVISISIEFYILPEKPQKDYAWIFKIAVHGEGGYEKVYWGKRTKCVQHCAVYKFIPHEDKTLLLFFTFLSLSYKRACSYSQHTNQHHL